MHLPLTQIVYEIINILSECGEIERVPKTDSWLTLDQFWKFYVHSVFFFPPNVKLRDSLALFWILDSFLVLIYIPNIYSWWIFKVMLEICFNFIFIERFSKIRGKSALLAIDWVAMMDITPFYHRLAHGIFISWNFILCIKATNL